MTEVTLFIFLALLPGFISTLVISSNITHKRIETFYFFVYSAILGVFSYAFYEFAKKISITVINIVIKKKITYQGLTIWSLLNPDNGQWSIEKNEILIASLFGVLIGIIITAGINHKILNRVLRRIRVTSKYGDESLFYYFLNSKDIEWVYVRDEENSRIIQGIVQSFSESSECQELLLHNVSVYSNDKKAKLLYKVPSLYLSFPYGKLQIEKIPEENF